MARAYQRRPSNENNYNYYFKIIILIIIKISIFRRNIPVANFTYKYLSTDEAIEDLKYFIETLKEENPKYNSSKVILFGGSYPGSINLSVCVSTYLSIYLSICLLNHQKSKDNSQFQILGTLAALARQKYNDIFAGAIASSAPMINSFHNTGYNLFIIIKKKLYLKLFFLINFINYLNTII